MIKLTKEENFKNLVEKSIEKFGDIFIFDINDYKNKEDITIRCKNGHVLHRTYENHLKSHGCQHCIPRMTQEQFIQESKKIHGDKFDYEFVEFVNVTTKVHLICNDCGEHIFQTPSNNLLGNSCIACSRKKPYTKETFIEAAKKIHGDRYDYSEIEYINIRTKIKIWCKECQKFFYQEPAKHFYGGCITCGGREKLTQDEFLKRAKEIYGDNTYDYSNVVYINMETKVELKCFRAGHAFKIDPKHHINRRQGCSICEFETRSERRPSKRDEIIKMCVDVHGDKYDYSLLSDRVLLTEKVKIYCKTCDRYFEQTIQTHLRSKIGCSRCAKKEKLTFEEFLRRSIEAHGDKYDFSETIINGVDNKIIVICKKCNKRFLVTTYNFLNGVGCTHCNKSIGELKIQQYLDNNNIKYESQKKFKDCKNINPLPFDFAILDDNNSVKGLIEFQGEQHYKIVRFKGMTPEKALETFTNLQKRDKIKSEYCFTNGIPLLLIHHSDKGNIQTILSQFIRSLDDVLECL